MRRRTTDPRPVSTPRDWDAATYDRVAAPQTRWGTAVLDRLPLAGDETVLDAGCGSGRVTEQLLDRLPDGRVIALDASPAMVAEARRRNPGVDVVETDMRALALGRRFDAITCLFSSVAYGDDLDAAVAALASHLTPGGVLVLDGWIRPGDWLDPSPTQVLSARSPDGTLAACRLGHSTRDGRHTHLDLQYLIGRTGQPTVHVVEHHELTLFTDDEYRAAFTRAGLTVEIVPGPFVERDRYAGVAPS